MASVFDVAAYILQQMGEMTTMKLQKLVYYSQAWSLVWDEEPLFPERIEAWANGPVVPNLYEHHRGMFKINEKAIQEVGDPSALSSDQMETIDVVLGDYGDKPSQWLSDMTHMELPWRSARQGSPEGARSSCEISCASMAEFYGALLSQKNAQA